MHVPAAKSRHGTATQELQPTAVITLYALSVDLLLYFSLPILDPGPAPPPLMGYTSTTSSFPLPSLDSLNTLGDVIFVGGISCTNRHGLEVHVRPSVW